MHAELVDERPVRLVAPVVEVAGDHERRVHRHGFADALAQRLDLPLPAALEQAQVNVDAVERRPARAQPDLAVEQAAALERMCGDVEILVRRDRIAGQERVAVVAVAGDRGAPVGDLAPVRVGDELVLRFRRPIPVPRGMPLVDADHFLQEQDVRVEPREPLAQLVDHHPPVELGESLVDVVGRDGEAHGGTKRKRPAILAA